MTETDIRTYSAPTMREALAKVRLDLGGDAVVLHTRQREQRSLLGKRSSIVEVTASPPPSESYRETRPVDLDVSGRPRPSRPIGRVLREVPRTDAAVILEEQLRRLKDAVDRLSRSAPPTPPENRDASSSSLERYLRATELDDRLVRECLEVAEREFPGNDDPADPRLIESLVLHLASRIPTESWVGLGDKTGVVAFVGPTGVGKTSTVAKLAVWAAAFDDRAVHLVSVAGDAIDHGEPLRRHAEKLGVPWSLARNPRDLREIVERRSQGELLLIDTPGRGPIDAEGIAELHDTLADVAEAWLVLSANMRDSSLRASLDAFDGFGYQRLILTKLDETPGAGAIATTAFQAKAPVRFVTMGQCAQSDLASADAALLAAWSLGGVVRRTPRDPRESGGADRGVNWQATLETPHWEGPMASIPGRIDEND